MVKMTLLAVSIATAALSSIPAMSSARESKPTLKIVQDKLLESADFYFVRGSIYNPSTRGAKNVVIRYYIWKKWMARDGHGTRIRDTGGLVEADLKYLPPKQTVDFTATGDDTAPVMTPESGLVPDPIKAEITAEWDD